MKKTTFLLSGLLIGALSAQANVVTAGWDFSQYVGDGFNSLDFQTGVNVVGANYSDFAVGSNFGLPLGPNAAPFGTLYYDGSFGSTNVIVNPQFDPLVPAGIPGQGSLFSNRFAGPGTGYESLESLQAEGQAAANPLAFLSRFQTNTVVFESTLASVNLKGMDWGINFASLSRVNGTGTIGVEFSTDGGTVWTDPQTVTVTGVDTAYAVTGPATTSESILVRASLTDGVFIDSFGITATAIPEPSAAGALFGLVALVAVARRRR